MGEWVLREACAQIKRWQLLGLPPLRVAVNVSARQFAQPDFAARAIQILNEEDVEPQSLELELTESAAMSNADATGQAFGLLKQHGIRICIDDFGTGYSCFSYLKRFSIDTLKIDKSFVEHVVSSSDEAALAETIIAIAHTLRMRVVAEGVESREQLDFFRDRGCDEWQGFYYCRPLPAEEAVHFMQGTAADSMASASVARLQQLVMGNGAGCLHEKSPSAAMEGIMPFHRKQT
jgi:EAL domain-containing protein (putative c-di-GMP-specific phosphodiesterase class I)